jgi:hypothetical protein
MDREELRRRAAACGLDKLDAAQLEQFAQGVRSTEALSGRLPKDLHWTQEPALTFSLVGKGGRR